MSSRWSGRGRATIRAAGGRLSSTGEAGERLDAAYFHSCNRGKRSIAVDFEKPEGQAIIRQLAARSDVLIENFKTGGLSKYGLDYESLKAINPKLIYCSITGFGQTGPYAARAGYDFMIQGMGGIMDLTGDPDGEPQKTGVAFADIFSGLYAVIAIQAALVRRAITGLGGHDRHGADGRAGQRARQSGAELSRLGQGAAPARQRPSQYRALSGVSRSPTAISSSPPAMTGRCATSAASSGSTGSPTIRAFPPTPSASPTASPSSRCSRKPAGNSARRRCSRRSRKPHVPAGPINSVAEVFADPQVIARAPAHRSARHRRGGRNGSLGALADHDRRRGDGGGDRRAAPWRTYGSGARRTWHERRMRSPRLRASGVDRLSAVGYLPNTGPLTPSKAPGAISQ